jgi:AcrR family transcriptional regulator
MQESRSAASPKDPSSYHHGNLRAALLQAGRELTAERGLEGFTLRQVAQRAGVSHAAPYHHFPDKAALSEGLAVAGYQELERRLKAAKNRTKGPASAKVEALGIAYVRFAIERSAEFQLMNRPELRRQPNSRCRTEPHLALPRAARAAFNVLLEAITAGQQDGSVVPGDIDQLALACWSIVHGFAMIILDGLMLDPIPPSRVQARLRQVLRLLASGIGH